MRLNEMGSTMTFEFSSASQRTGTIVVASFALVSALALAFIASRTTRLATVIFQRDHGSFRPPEMLFFSTQLGHHAGCLVLSDMFISTAGLIDFSWVSRSGLSQGSTCSAQVALKQIGIWSTCWFTATLGVHTLISFVFHIRPARWHTLLAVIIGWAIAFTAGLAPFYTSNVYGPTGPSCGITHSHLNYIFALEALPIILAAFVSAAVYSLVYIVLHKNLRLDSIQGLLGLNSTNLQEEDGPEEYHKFIRTIIWTMFWFPLVFMLLFLPFCITHVLKYAGIPVLSSLNIFADVCISMLGLVNVCLLYNTFRVIGLVYGSGVCPGEIAAETVKTFGHDASCESPTVSQHKFPSQFAILLHENGHQTHNPTQSSSNHLRASSWASVNSRVVLLGSEEVSCMYVHAEAVPLASSEITPPGPGRRFGEGALLPSTNLDSLSHPSSVTMDTRLLPLVQDQQQSFRPTKDTDVPEGCPRESTFKSEALPTLNLSHTSAVSHPLSSRSRHMSMTSVWSQETGYTTSHPPDAECQEAYSQLAANLLVTGVMSSDQAGVAGETNRTTPFVPSSC